MNQHPRFGRMASPTAEKAVVAQAPVDESKLAPVLRCDKCKETFRAIDNPKSIMCPQCEGQ